MIMKAKRSDRPNLRTNANLPSLMNAEGTSIGLSLLLSLAILVLLASLSHWPNYHRTTLDISTAQLQAINTVAGPEVPGMRYDSIGTSDNNDGSGSISRGAVEASGNGADEKCDGIDGVCGDFGDKGIPFGLWWLNDEARGLWGTKYTVSTIWTSPNTILDLLDEAQAKGMHVVVSLSAFGKDDYKNPDETFNLSLWKAKVDLYRGINLDEYTNDGTIIVHYLVDEPKSRSNWGGQVIANDVLDEMARYSKEIWPNMLTAVRASPVTLETHAGGYQVPLPSWTWRYLDTAWLQYSSRKGEINQYIAAESQSAARQRLGLIVGLQALTGGDGSSRIPGPPDYSSAWAMSKDELLKYGTPLINSPSSCAFLIWTYKYDLDPSYNYVYFDRPDIDASVVTLKQLADQQPWHSCKFEPNPPHYDRTVLSLLTRLVPR